MKNSELMTGTEKRVASGKQLSTGDVLTRDKLLEELAKDEEKLVMADGSLVQDAFRKAYKQKRSVKSSNGTVFTISAIQLIALNKIEFWLDPSNAKDMNVKEVLSIDDKAQKIEVDGDSASDIFKGVVAGATPNGSDTESDK